MLDKNKIEKIAKLAKINLAPEEKEKFLKEFSQILDFIDKLKEVEMSGSDGFYFDETTSCARQDKAVTRDKDSIKKLISNVPSKSEGLVKTKKIK